MEEGESDQTTIEDKGTAVGGGYDDDDDDDEEEVNTTQPFQPGAASTPYQPPGAASDPYHGGEEHEMSQFGPEHSGLDDTTPFVPQTQREQAWKRITALYPDASATDLEAYYDPC